MITARTFLTSLSLAILTSLPACGGSTNESEEEAEISIQPAEPAQESPGTVKIPAVNCVPRTRCL